MRGWYELIIEQGNIWALLIIGALFVGAVIAQTAHEDGKKWGRPVQYTIAAIYIILFIWLMIEVNG